ncbi:cytochrome b5-like heme/steroid binding domain-containing protein, partial [Amanita rubescens]
TSEDVQKHNSESSCWITHGENVYGVTGFVNNHPGGEGYILQHAGKDAREIMQNAEMHDHPSSAYDMLEEYVIVRLGKLGDVGCLMDVEEATDARLPYSRQEK